MGAPDQHKAEDVARRARKEMQEVTANLRAVLAELRGGDNVYEPPDDPRGERVRR